MQGDPGIEGPAGLQGVQGLQGDPGERGERGKRGHRGHCGHCGKCGPRGHCGPCGPCGPCGERGPRGHRGHQGKAGDSAECACVAQMKNVIAEVIRLFPSSTIIVNYENGGTVFGIPNSLIPSGKNSGIFILTDGAGVITHRIDICKIASIILTGTDSFVNSNGTLRIRFLPTPSPVPTGCGADCEAAVRNTFNSLIETGVRVNVRAGGVNTEAQTVTTAAYGATLLSNNIIVSNCFVEDIK